MRAGTLVAWCMSNILLLIELWLFASGWGPASAYNAMLVTCNTSLEPGCLIHKRSVLMAIVCLLARFQTTQPIDSTVLEVLVVIGFSLLRQDACHSS